jgi:O-antigen/teichoic acid export membrane protein
MQAMAARGLSRPDYGRFVLLTTTGLFLLVLVSSGIPQALRRLVGLDAANLRIAVGWLLKVQLPLSLAAALAVTLASKPLATFMGDSNLMLPLGLMAGELLVRASLLEPGWQLLNGLGRHGLQSCLMGLYGVLRMLCVAGALMLDAGLSGAILGLVAAAGLAAMPALAAMVVLGRRLTVHHGSSSYKRPIAESVKLIPGSPIFAWAGSAFCYEVLGFLIVPMNLWLLTGFSKNLDLVGLYGASLVTARVALSLGLAVSGGTYSHLVLAFSQDRMDEFGMLAVRAFRAMLLMFVPATIVAVLGGGFITSLLYGPDYAESGDILGILVAATSTLAGMALFGEVLAAAGQFQARLRVMIPLIGVSTVATFLLIQLAGPSGAAWGLLCTGLCGLGAMGVCVYRTTGNQCQAGSLSWKASCRGVLLGPGAANSPQLERFYECESSSGFRRD